MPALQSWPSVVRDALGPTCAVLDPCLFAGQIDSHLGLRGGLMPQVLWLAGGIQHFCVVSLEGSSGEDGPLLGWRGLICVSQDEPPSPEVLTDGKHMSWEFRAMK